MFIHSRRDLSRWLTLCMGSILLLFITFAYYTEVNDELNRLDRLLYRHATVMTSSVRYRFQGNEWQTSLDYVPSLGSRTWTVSAELDNRALVYVRWYTDRGELSHFWGSPKVQQLSSDPGFETLVLRDVEYWDEPLTHDHHLSVLSASTLVRQLTIPIYRDIERLGYLQLAIPLTSVQDDLAAFRLFSAITIPIVLVIISLASSFFGRLAMQPLQQAHHQLERFTSDVSHELRAPLAAILSNAQVGLLSTPDEEQHYRLQNIVETTRSMNSLVDQLLLLARHSGMIAPELLAPLNLTAWLPRIAHPYGQSAQEHALTFRITVPNHSLWVHANTHLLAQAIINLLNNAIKYTPSYGDIHVKLSAQHRMALIDVEDNGVGIAQDDLPHIFDRFYRAGVECTPNAESFGLGLAIAQQIIRAHGGKITVNSTPGKGSIFSVALPLVSSERDLP